MGTVSRPVKAGDARRPFAPPRRMRPVKRHPSGAATTAAGLELANELLGLNTVSLAIARAALDRMRRGAKALDAVFWIVSGTTANCVLRASIGGDDQLPASVELGERTAVSERLRRGGAFVCRAGEQSGVEQLVPGGVQSFAVVIVPGANTATGVLVVGWDTYEPPCDEHASAHLRLAATVLLRTLAAAPDSRVKLADAILGSLAERVAVIDPDGVIVAVNAAWTTFPLPIKALELVEPGANYFELCGHAIIDGHPEFAAILDGVHAVTRGLVPRYRATFPSPESTGDESFLVTATPLQHDAGGAVITHANVTPEKISALAQRIGETHFYTLTDAIPIPVWIQDAAGCVIHGNERWRQIAHAHAAAADGRVRWIDMVHPDDKARAAAAFDEAFASRQPLVRELRVKAADGTFRWSLCSGAPFSGIDGRLDAYICSCFDVGAQRNAEWALGEMSVKLLAAQEDERSRIGRELHDDLGQQTALLAANIETLLQRKRASHDTLRKGMLEARGRVQDLAVAIHNLSHELHPPKLKLLGLVKTLQALCRDVAKDSHVQVAFRAGEIPADIPERVALCACRVAQEALRNAVSHSGARTIEVSLTMGPSGLSLQITDTGHGFDPIATPSTGIGLLSMRERVELNAGRMVIDTSSHGTTIVATLPIRMPAPVSAGHEMRSPFDRRS